MANKKKKEKKKLCCISFSFQGKRYYCYGKTQAIAAAKVQQKKEELQNGLYKAGDKLTLDEYFKRWEEHREGTVRSSTVASTRTQYGSIKQFEIDKKGHKLGGLRLAEIDKNMIISLQKSLLNDGMKTASVNKRIKLLDRLLREAVNERIIQWNPAQGIKPLQRTETPARETVHRALTIEETKAFLDAAKDSWYYPLFQFMLYTGMRCGEAGAIRVSDIKPDCIQIRRTLTTNADHQVIIGDYPKTSAGIREIPLNDDIREIIQRQKLQNHICNDSNVISMDKPIFTSARGLYIRGSRVDERIRKLCKKIGIEPFTSHAFRDTFATRAIEGGMNPKTLQVILGHSNYNLTMSLYAHVMDDTIEEEFKLVKII